MSSRPQTPSHLGDGGRPTSFVAGPDSLDTTPATARSTDFANSHAQGAPTDTSPLSQSVSHQDHAIGSAIGDGGLPRSDSQMSQSQTLLPSRGGTLKKKGSLKKSGSIRRSASRRSSHAGSVRSLNLGEKEKYAGTEEMRSAFYTPVPTSGNPTELLANRFQAWRKVLKDLITYFRDVQKGYETRSKSLISAANVMSNTLTPSDFMANGGLGDATQILRNFHKNALNESNKAKDLENEVIMQLTGLRSDLQQKVKEIKSLSGDFKNSVDRETDGTRRAVRSLQEACGLVDADPASTSGRGDPYLLKMAVERQLERQLEEENYLHRAYLNLESSGRELESIVVGEIQKAYIAYSGILKREADEAFEAVEKLREGPVAMPKDKEWDHFVSSTDQMVDPRIPIRSIEHLTYPGKDHPAGIEVRSGMLERKSKYLKNYTPGWYVLSATHLHEFKSADRIAFQQPIMSLYLPEQKLGSHSEIMSGSHKFMLKGRQTGGMHRGHSWIFRAESYETMMAWFNDIKELTEKRGEERNAFVRRQHARSMSGGSIAGASIGSSEGGLEEDAADAVPFSDEKSVRSPMADPAIGGAAAVGLEERQIRPQPGGRFPSDLNVDRGLQAAPLSPSSGESERDIHTHPSAQQTDHDALAGASSLPGSGVPFSDPESSTAFATQHQTQAPATVPVSQSHRTYPENTNEEWIAPTAAGVGGAALASHYRHHESQPSEPQELATADTAPLASMSAAPGIAAVASTSTESPYSGRGGNGYAETMSQETAPTTLASSVHPDEDVQGSAEESRPAMPHTAKSATTISDLHIPGQYPRPSVV